jgi:hypothetical protein
MASFLFGMVGLGFFTYGKRAGRMIPLGAGIALMVVPYFVTNVLALILVGCALSATPWFLREA